MGGRLTLLWDVREAPWGSEFTEQLKVADSICAISSIASQANIGRIKEQCKALFLGITGDNKEVIQFNVSPNVMLLVRRNYKAKAFQR